MAPSPPDILQLAVQGRLLSVERCRELAAQFRQHSGGSAKPEQLARWLIDQGAVTRYQAKVLLAGRAGPFLFDGYRVCDRHASGPLVGVFRAVHVETGHPVCLRFLNGGAFDEPGGWAKIVEQADTVAAATCGEPRLSRCYHAFDLASRKCLVAEDVSGTSLAQILAAGRPLAVHDACHIAHQAALALAHLQQRGLSHGEVRPENLWIGPGRSVKLLTFPLAADPLAPAAAARLARLGPDDPMPPEADYVAPELLKGNASPETSSDVYSLGCALYHMVTGRVPFDGPDVAAKLTGHREGSPRSIVESNPKVPAAVARLVGHMMAKEPALRYQQAERLAEALAPHVGEDSPSEPPSPPPTSSAYDAWLETRSQEEPAADAQRPAASEVETAPAIRIEGTPQSVVGRNRRAGSNGPSRVAVGGVAAFLLVALLAVLLNNRLHEPPVPPAEPLAQRPTEPPNDESAAPPLPDDAPPAEDETALVARTPARPAPSATALQPVEAPIWDSPTAGAPLALDYLAPGVQVIIALRPAEILAHPEAEKLFDPRTSGPLGEWIETALGKAVGVPAGSLESVLIGLLEGRLENGVRLPPRVSLVARLREPVEESQLLAAWGSPARLEAEDADGAKHAYYATDDRAYYVVPSAEQGRTQVVVAPPDEMPAILEFAGSAPPLVPELEALLATSDADRHLTVLFAPGFVFGSGSALFAGPAARLRDPLERFLEVTAGGTIQSPGAVMWSAHLDERLFLELTVSNSFAGEPDVLIAQTYRDRVVQLPQAVLDELWELDVSAYSGEVLKRFSGMLEVLGDYTRAATRPQQAVLRAYLPGVAAHNLALGTHLTLLERAGQGTTVAVADRKPVPTTVAEKLRQTISLAFPQKTLEHTLEEFGEQIGVEIRILGGDLQLEGITKNQSFGLDERDQPAVEILKRIMSKANPDGKLVWVVKPDEEGEAEIIYVTTRAAAAARGDRLPAELEQP